MSKKMTSGRNEASGQRQSSPIIVAAALRELERSQSDEIDIFDLTRVIEQAIEAQRNRAMERDIRLSYVSIDDIQVVASEIETTTRLGMMLAAAIEGAVPGSLVECNTAVERGGAVVRIKFLRPTGHRAGGAYELIGREFAARWAIIEM